MKQSPRGFLIHFLALTSLCLGASVFSGCVADYIFHAAAGQLELQRHSISVEEALHQGSLTPVEKERLRLVAKVKIFARERLGLSSTESYTTVYMRSRLHPVYTLCASPKDHLSRVTWWFPIVGRMPYLGFFDPDRALKEKKRLMDKGLDVFMGQANAYSTLGWFRDPVTLDLLRGKVTRQVNTLLHEMTHSTLYMKGQGEFNEGLAVLVGAVGTVRFFEDLYGPDHSLTREARNSLEDERLFSVYLSSVLRDLESLYGSPLSYELKLLHREEIFRRSRRDFETLKARFRTDEFLYFEGFPLNNASLLALSLYHRQFSLLEAVLRANRGSVRRTLALFRELSREGPDILAHTKRWLLEGGGVRLLTTRK